MSEAILSSSPQRPLEFPKPPRRLSIQLEAGSYRVHCGVVHPNGAEDPVLVAVTRHRSAATDVYFTPPSLAYLENLSGHERVKQAGLKHRLPRDEAELHELLAGLG